MNTPKCSDCQFSCSAIKAKVYKGQYKETEGFLCCHSSEQVRPDALFTGKTHPLFCPLKCVEE